MTMAAHLDVVGYLLAASVFSVMFLSGRLHASADAVIREASAASWRVREALQRHERVSPTELSGLLLAVRRSKDTVSVMSRALNLLLVAVTVTLGIDGLRLHTEGAEHPTDALLLLAGLVVAGLAVGLLGELDARRVEYDVQSALTQTTLGRIAELSDLVSSPERRPEALARLHSLRSSFPTWGLLDEVEATIELQETPLAGYERLSRLIETTDDLYLTSTVGVACALRAGRHDLALRLLETLGRRGPLGPRELELRRGVRLHAGHLDALLEVPASERAWEPDAASPDSMAAWSEVERLESAIDIPAVLDVRTSDIPELRALMDRVVAWNSDGGQPSLSHPGPFNAILSAVDPACSDRRAALTTVLHQATVTVDPGTLETIALLLLLGDLPRAAIDVFELAIPAQPKSARVHWGHAVGCWRWGWIQKANESLQRAIGLDPEDPVLRATDRRMQGEAFDLRSLGFGDGSLDPIQRLRFALIGVAVPATGGTSPRDAFLDARLAEAARLPDVDLAVPTA